MASLESSVFISVFVALLLLFVDLLVLPNMIITALPIIVFSGFIASAMASSENNSFRVGGITGGVIAVIFFLVEFFTAPTLTFDLYGLNFNMALLTEGFIYLILSFILSLAIFMLLGAFGGLIAQELFSTEEESDKEGNSKTYHN
ncbi:MAG TPA: hypothetical protein VMC48_02405 [Methanobacterium sp.]|nr:hypothetical protein [Methanobacterium sp.]